MILSDKEISLLGLPATSSHCVDLTLGDQWATMRPSPMPLRLNHVSEGEFEVHSGAALILPPLSFCLCVAQEAVELPADVASLIVPRSGAARCGLHVEQTMAWPWFSGSLVLEVTNLAPRPIVLTKGMSIAALVLLRAEPAVRPYAGRYQGQAGLALPISRQPATPEDSRL